MAVWDGSILRGSPNVDPEEGGTHVTDKHVAYPPLKIGKRLAGAQTSVAIRCAVMADGAATVALLVDGEEPFHLQPGGSGAPGLLLGRGGQR